MFLPSGGGHARAWTEWRIELGRDPFSYRAGYRLGADDSSVTRP